MAELYNLVFISQFVWVLEICISLHLKLLLLMRLLIARQQLINYYIQHLIVNRKKGFCFRFVPEEIFVSKYFHISLLAVHILILACIAPYAYRLVQSRKRENRRIFILNFSPFVIKPDSNTKELSSYKEVRQRDVVWNIL